MLLNLGFSFVPKTKKEKRTFYNNTVGLAIVNNAAVNMLISFLSDIHETSMLDVVVGQL